MSSSRSDPSSSSVFVGEGVWRSSSRYSDKEEDWSRKMAPERTAASRVSPDMVGGGRVGEGEEGRCWWLKGPSNEAHPNSSSPLFVFHATTTVKKIDFLSGHATPYSVPYLKGVEFFRAHKQTAALEALDEVDFNSLPFFSLCSALFGFPASKARGETGETIK